MISSKNLRRYAIAGVINDGIDNTDLPGMVPEFSEVEGKTRHRHSGEVSTLKFP
jgi:hypothetical protein